MKIFFSWSGDRSGAVAAAFRSWLPYVLQTVEPLFSRETEKGLRWSEEIHQQLRDSSLGMIFLTQDNLLSPWINFEAGALSKLEKARVYTLLFDLTPKVVPLPLAQFQHTQITHDEILQMVLDIRRHLDIKTPESVITKSFERFWPELVQALEPIPAPSRTSNPSAHSNPIAQLLDLSREMNSRILYLEEFIQESLVSSNEDFERLLIRQDAGLHDRLEGLLESLSTVGEDVAKEGSE